MHSNILPAAAVMGDQEVMAIGIAQAELSQLHEAWDLGFTVQGLGFAVIGRRCCEG